MKLIYGEHILGSVFPLPILTAHVWEWCHRTALPRSSRYIWGIYHIVRTKFSLTLLIGACPLLLVIVSKPFPTRDYL